MIADADENTALPTRAPTTIPFDQIAAPGAYVCGWSGHLLRVPEQILDEGLRPLKLRHFGPLTVTKISDDPHISISEARTRAASLQLDARF